jgi:hypothetical protein
MKKIKSMGSSEAIDNYDRARIELCQGHYDIKKLETRIDKIYSKAREQEDAFSKKIKIKRWFSLTRRQAQIVVNTICKMLLITRKPKVVCDDTEALSGAACYGLRKIRTRYSRIGLMTTLHELAHHFQHYEGFRCDDHGPGFLEAEQLIFETFEKALKTTNLWSLINKKV